MCALRFGTVSALTGRDEGTELDLDVGHEPATIRPGDHIFHRTVTDVRNRSLSTGKATSRLTEVKAEYRRHVVNDVTYDGETTTLRFEHRLPQTGHILEDLHGDSYEWSTSPPPEMPDFPRQSADYGAEPDWLYTRWEQPCGTVPEPPNVKEMDFHHLEGDGALRTVNQFLAGGPDGRVDHRLLGVNGFRHAFGAVYDGSLLSVAVLEHAHNRDIDDYETTRYLTRLANHPHRPPNTSSWMLGRIRGWLRHHTDIKKIVALAGVDGNEGTCYDGAGFDDTGTVELQADETTVDTSWTKRRWVATL